MHACMVLFQVGKPIYFMLEIKNARDIPKKFTKVQYCREMSFE
jgi:hypothetical protein